MDCPHLRTAGLKLVLTWTRQPQGEIDHGLSLLLQTSRLPVCTLFPSPRFGGESSTRISPLKRLQARASLANTSLWTWTFSPPFILTLFLQRAYSYSLAQSLALDKLNCSPFKDPLVNRTNFKTPGKSLARGYGRPFEASWLTLFPSNFSIKGASNSSLHISPFLKASTVWSREEGPREAVDIRHKD